MNYRNVFRRAGLLLVAAALLIMLAGCGTELNGKWRSTSESKTQLSFSSTGKVVMSSDGISLTGTYTVDEDKLTMVMTAPDGEVYTIEATFTVVDKRLFLENSKGQVEVFER